MTTHRHIDAICMGITALTLLVTLLFMNGQALGLQAMPSEENSGQMFTQNDLNASWDTTGATKITLSDAGSSVVGNGAYVYEGDIHIVYAGKYVLTGELKNGTVLIEADGDDKIYLMLDGASIHSMDDAALRVEQADKVFLTLQEGTENVLSATPGEKAISEGIDGAIYSRDDLTINGAGTLTITSEDQHGIVCNDDLVISGGTISITAGQDAMHANDSVRIRDADITLTAGDDGMTASNDDGTALIYMESGTVRIPSCYEGLEAVNVTIAGGTLEISPTDDGINASGETGKPAINITGGEITIVNESGRDADGLDSNGDLSISGGRLLISVSDRGGSCAIDCSGVCTISGGTVLACGSSGMAEGFDETSPQGFLMHTISAEAGATVSIKDADGDVLLSEEVPCSFSSVLVSAPEMHVGDVCTLMIGDTETDLTIDNRSAAGGFGGWQMRNNDFGRQRRGLMNHAYNTVSSEPQAPAEEPSADDKPEDAEDSGADDMQAPSQPENGFGMTPPDMSGSEIGGTPPPMPDDANGMTPPDFQQGDMSGDASQGNLRDGMNGGMRPDAPQNRRNVDPNAENPSPAADAEGLSEETWILLGLSAAVLLCGCVIASIYRKRV